DQTANEFVCDNFTGFKNLQIIKCDGKDVFDSMNAMTAAREHALKHSEPVIVHAMCVRIGNHSNSDNHEWYRDEKERAEAKAQDPLPRFQKELLKAKIFTEKEIEKIEAQAKEELLTAHKAAVKAPNPTPESIYDFVVPEAYVPQTFV